MQAYKTDTRPPEVRRHSVQLRISELRIALNAAEKSLAQLDTEIELAERAREQHAAE